MEIGQWFFFAALRAAFKHLVFTFKCPTQATDLIVFSTCLTEVSSSHRDGLSNAVGAALLSHSQVFRCNEKDKEGKRLIGHFDAEDGDHDLTISSVGELRESF